MDIALGHAARPLWALRTDGTFLNHGSYGACPHPVLDAQRLLREEMESHPDAFLARIRPTGPDRVLRHVAASLAQFTGTEADRIALVENATTGVQSVLDSLVLSAGDEILATDHQYNAVRLAVEARCRAAGALPRVVHLPLPTTSAEIAQRVLDAAGPRTKLVILDHITSPSALVLPLSLILPELRRRGIPVLVDGAHALGQLPLNLASLGADWYVSNAHKWLYAPRGSAMLWAGDTVAASTRPVVTSHYVELGFPQSFDYVGTRDYTGFLAIPEAIRFFESLGAQRLWNHEARLVEAGTEALLAAGALPVGPRELCAAMRAFVLPQRRPAAETDAAAVMTTMWERERIQIRCALVGGKLLLRFCAQAYVAAEDLVRLGEAMQRHGWPERR